MPTAKQAQSKGYRNMKKQFCLVSSRYGAPMGRSPYGIPSDCPLRAIRLFKVNLDSGGYDDGGAYWGGDFGTDPLYCARYGDTYRAFTRAYSREHAAKILRIPTELLKVKV